MISLYKNYAKALCEVIKKSNGSTGVTNSYNKIRKEAEEIIQLIDISKQLKGVFISPVVSQNEKQAVMEKICHLLNISEYVKNTFVILARKNRLSKIDQFLNVLDEVIASEEGRLLGKVESAQPLTAADLESISKAFENKLSKKVTFNVSTDPSLIAGVKVTVGGITYDRTIQSQVRRFRESIIEAVQ